MWPQQYPVEILIGRSAAGSTAIILENAVDTTDFTDDTDYQFIMNPWTVTYQVNDLWIAFSLESSVSVQSA
jgi:hypothetical protein